MIKTHTYIAATAGAIGLMAAALFFSGVASFNTEAARSAHSYVAEAYTTMTQSNDSEKAKALLTKALEKDPDNTYAQYNLARIAYVEGDFERARELLTTVEESDPSYTNALYLRGLVEGFDGNLAAAQKAFEAFIAAGHTEKAGYLDVAWVYFQQGNVDAAHKTLATAIDLYPNDAWLLTSLSGVLVAQGDFATADNVSREAIAAIDALTDSTWQAHYAFNDPARAAEGITQLRAVALHNQLVARSEGSDVPEAPVATFAAASPQGAGAGLAVSACEATCTFSTCYSGFNVCGARNSGSRNSCTGQCSATVPANPSGACSVATPCGPAEGRRNCANGCNLTAYPLCLNPDGSTGSVTWVNVANGAGLATYSATIIVDPDLVHAGNTTVVSWFSAEVQDCTVTGTNGDSWTGDFGQEVSGPIMQETVYTLSCRTFDGATITDTGIVKIIPIFEEF